MLSETKINQQTSRDTMLGSQKIVEGGSNLGIGEYDHVYRTVQKIDNNFSFKQFGPKMRLGLHSKPNLLTM